MHPTILIPAGGSGSRFGGLRKQYRLIGGRPVLYRVVEAFCQWRDDCDIIVAVPEGEHDHVANLLAGLAANPTLVSGGSTRQESVLKGLRVAPPGAQEGIVLIHDGVRPFVEIGLLERVWAAAANSGAAAPALEVVDTLRRAAEGWFSETVARDGLFRMQTPQAFKLAEILTAHEQAANEGYQATDDVELYARYVGPVAVIKGSEDNFKITTQRDLDTAIDKWRSQCA